MQVTGVRVTGGNLGQCAPLTQVTRTILVDPWGFCIGCESRMTGDGPHIIVLYDFLFFFCYTLGFSHWWFNPGVPCTALSDRVTCQVPCHSDLADIHRHTYM